jgi:predicted esterase
VWFVCHGMGYLSKYFIRYFKDLNPEENYIIAPQAPSTFYQGKAFKHIGANWLTRENTRLETENIVNYFDAILEAENIKKSTNIIVLGYSQGVSVAMRYVAKRQLQCSQLVIHSGSIPKELTANDFKFLKAKISFIYGINDEYITSERVETETALANSLFNNKITIKSFNGVHEVNTTLINALV